MTKYLDENGVKTLWEKTKNTFSKHGALSDIPEFDKALTYNIGDTVRYTDGLLYEFINKHQGSWSDSDVKRFNLYTKFSDEISDKASKNGYYSALTAGSAENLVGSETKTSEFYYRPTANTDSVASGAAIINEIHGNTLVFNQLWPANTQTVTVPANSYYAMYNPSFDKFKIFDGVNGQSYIIEDADETIKYNSDSQSYTITEKDTGTKLYNLSFLFNIHNKSDAEIALTKLKQLAYTKYKQTDGRFINFTAEQFITSGINRWDEEYVSNAYINTSSSTGEIIIDKTRKTFATRNFITIPTNVTKIYIHTNSSNNNYINRFAAYDKDKQLRFSCNGSQVENQITTLYSEFKYIKFDTSITYGNIYKRDICVNFAWSGAHNGEYESYWESTLPLNIIKIKGKQITYSESGERQYGKSEVIFPNGMYSINDNIYDKLTATSAYKVCDIIDLGSLSWINTNSSGYIADMPIPSTEYIHTCDEKGIANVRSSKYVTYNTLINTHQYSIDIDKNANVIVIIDKICESQGITGEDFKKQLHGHYLIYQLANPIEYKLDKELNLSYKVDDFGVEYITELDADNDTVPVSSPAKFDITYGINAADTIRTLNDNYLSLNSDQTLTDNQQTLIRNKIQAAATKDITSISTSINNLEDVSSNLYKTHQSQYSMDEFTKVIGEILDVSITKTLNSPDGYTYDASSGENSLASVRETLNNILSQQDTLGNVSAISIDTDDEYKRLNYPTILYGIGAPSASNRPTNIEESLPWTGIPIFIGQLYIDISVNSGGLYYAKGQTSINDWVNA